MSRIGLGLVACLVVLSACGKPQTISMSSPPPSPSRLAPEIALPVEIAQYVQVPCTMLKPGQAVTKELSEGFNDGPKCTWSAKTPQQPELTATVDLTSGGLEGLYRKRSRLPYFEPTDVQGYPAVRYDPERTVPDQGRCTVSVGLSETALLTVTSRIADPKTLNYPVPCPDADLLAGAIVTDITRG
ncbi:hypothetical protein JOF56_006243 [Kibdelosporangium banguiense]|uniref:DUF3558 domain-containing protein n=1 Tax=Kibdelosporangium banguiense TaxID=1365924 RepID=A0ABS4TN76_9PSEU|nr:DUF3558 family protein [Kibdelosporangium banguiense]MBP2325858.1 hypothetical protein [Kibdelosporangium banguiense]